MKKNLLLLATLLLFFSNCKKTENQPINSPLSTPVEYTLTSQNIANIEGVKNLPNQDSKRMAFRLLSPIEKYGAWLENIKLVSTNFTPEQKAVVTELVNFISPKLFDKPDRGQTSSFSGKWLDKATHLFTKDQIRNIAYQLFSTTDVKITVQTNTEEIGLKTCNCATDSYFSCRGDDACPPYETPCKDPSSWGCGLVWWSSCDNICIIAFPPPAE